MRKDLPTVGDTIPWPGILDGIKWRKWAKPCMHHSLLPDCGWNVSQTPASVTSLQWWPTSSTCEPNTLFLPQVVVVVAVVGFLGSGNFNTTARRITKTQPFALISSLSLHRWKSWYLNVCGSWCELEKAPLWKDVDSDSLREGNLCLNYGHSTRPDPWPLLMPQVWGKNYTGLGRGPAFSTSESVRPSSWLTS